jgi:hypothetical protein
MELAKSIKPLKLAGALAAIRKTFNGGIDESLSFISGGRLSSSGSGI